MMTNPQHDAPDDPTIERRNLRRRVARTARRTGDSPAGVRVRHGNRATRITGRHDLRSASVVAGAGWRVQAER